MIKQHLTDFLLYRYRYILSFIALFFIVASLLFVSGTMIPGGISESEMLTTTRSGNLSLGALIGNQADNIIQLPYRTLQAASLHLFGVSNISIKLPSLILAALSIAIFYKVLQLWFRRNVAIITVLLTITSSQFLLQSQLGTAGILYFFWGVALLLTTSMMARTKKYRSLWFIAAAIIAGLSLYTSFMLYIIVPLIFAAIAHPHARFVVFRQPLWALAVGVVVFLVTITPLTIGLLAHPTVGLELLAGRHMANGTFSLSQNIANLAQYINFYSSNSGRILQPAYSLGLLLLGVIGLVHLLSTKYTAKNYIMSAWLLFMVPILILYPEIVAVTMLPLMFLVAFSIEFLIKKWYRMFPFNPYARTAGFIPLMILIVALCFSSLERFTYGYIYDSSAANAYKEDVSLLSSDLKNMKPREATIITPENIQSFYSVYAKYYKGETKLTITTDSSKGSFNGRTYVASGITSDKSTASTILVASHGEDATRFYVYENTAR